MCTHPTYAGPSYSRRWKVQAAIHLGALCVLGPGRALHIVVTQERSSGVAIMESNTSDNKYFSNAWTRTAN